MYLDNTTCLIIPYCATAYDDCLLPSGNLIIPLLLLSILLTLSFHTAPNSTLLDPQSRIASNGSAVAVLVAFPRVGKDQVDDGFQSGTCLVNSSYISHFVFFETLELDESSPSSTSMLELASALDLFAGLSLHRFVE